MSEPVIDDTEMMDDTETTEATPEVNHVFKWSTPPTAPKRIGGSGRTISKHWLDVAHALRENTGQWAQIGEHDSNVKASNHAARVRSGKSKAFAPKDDFETVSRPLDGDETTEPTSWGVFARHTGGTHVVVEPEGDSGTPESSTAEVEDTDNGYQNDESVEGDYTNE